MDRRAVFFLLAAVACFLLVPLAEARFRNLTVVVGVVYLLLPVYEALDLPWDPGTAGAVEDEIDHGAAPDPWTVVRDGLLAEYEREYEVVEAELDPETVELARCLAAEHRPA